jgi:hypothetical protein
MSEGTAKQNIEGTGLRVDLAEIFENGARQILNPDLDHGAKLAQELAVALGEGKIALNHKIASEAIDIARTKSFADYRKQVMEKFPAVKGVSLYTSDGDEAGYDKGTWARIYLKEPTLLHRMSAAFGL